MAQTPTIYKGDDAKLNISGMSHSILAISDFSLTLGKGTAEQELLGSKGNYTIAGAISCEGSLTSCKLDSTGLVKLVQNMIDKSKTKISGSCGPNSLHFDLDDCVLTGFDFSLAGADEIIEGSIDFTHLTPYRISVQTDIGYTNLYDW